jgi:hypothetical protein
VSRNPHWSVSDGAGHTPDTSPSGRAYAPSIMPVALPLDTEGIVCMIADGDLEVWQINLAIESVSRWNANVVVLHAESP